MCSNPSLIPIVDLLLVHLHLLSSGRYVENHEEDKREADHDWYTDADFVEKLIVRVWMALFDPKRVGLDDAASFKLEFSHLVL